MNKPKERYPIETIQRHVKLAQDILKSYNGPWYPGSIEVPEATLIYHRAMLKKWRRREREYWRVFGRNN